MSTRPRSLAGGVCNAAPRRYVSHLWGGRPRQSQTPLAQKLAGRYAGVVEVEFELLGDIQDIEPIGVNLSIRERKSLKSRFGGRRWRKLKGVALVRFPNGEVRRAELHRYEAHGVGRRKMKVKRVLD